MSLCAQCTQIPFSRLFGDAKVPRHWALCDLSHAKRNKPDCVFCAFLTEAYELAYDLQPGQVSDENKNPRFGFQILARSDDGTSMHVEEPWFERAGLKADRGAGPALWLQFSGVAQNRAELTEPMVCVSCVRNDNSADDSRALIPRQRYGQEAASRRLNCTIINEWIRICTEEHSGLCTSATMFKRQTLKLRLVDVLSHEIVLDDNESPYVALSYVWGDVRKEDFFAFWQSLTPNSTHNKLPVRLPKTIQDAIIFTGTIGLRYLWVDCLCIDQTNAEELKRDIANMHLVFECAHLTVAALDGLSANSGICGISRDFKQFWQPRVKVPYGDLTATYVHDIWSWQGESPWEKRGWTLQELLLSKRILLFDQHYVSMICSNEFFHSLLQIHRSLDRPKTLTANTHFWENGFEVNLYETKWNFRQYDSLLANYTRRSLTDQTDVVSACLGALNQITRNTGVGFLQGLPRADLHIALLWKPHYAYMLSRRHEFPSWSWTGWIGRIEYHYCLDALSSHEELGKEEHQKRVKNKVRRETFEEQNVKRNDTAFITDDGSTTICVSSQSAKVSVRKVRSNGQKVKGIKKGSERPDIAIGDHWLLLNRAEKGVRNEVGEVTVFESIDYSFQVNPDVSRELERNNERCELMFIKYFPALPNTWGSEDEQWLFDMVGCLVLMRNLQGKAERIGFVFLRLEDWIDLNAVDEVVYLV